MPQETRRSFNRKLLGSLMAYGLIEMAFGRDLFADAVKPVVQKWLVELHQLSQDLKDQKIKDIDFQAKLPTGADLDSEATVSSRLLLTAKIAPSGALVFEYQIDGGVWTQVDATTVCQTGQCDADWDTALLPPGHYKVRGRAGSTTSNGHGFHRGAPSVPLAPSGISVSMAWDGKQDVPVAGGVEVALPDGLSIDMAVELKGNWAAPGTGNNVITYNDGRYYYVEFQHRPDWARTGGPCRRDASRCVRRPIRPMRDEAAPSPDPPGPPG